MHVQPNGAHEFRGESEKRQKEWKGKLLHTACDDPTTEEKK